MRIILAGTGSSVGKTTIATGIMKALSDKFNVQPFKVGPNYRLHPKLHQDLIPFFRMKQPSCQNTKGLRGFFSIYRAL